MKRVYAVVVLVSVLVMAMCVPALGADEYTNNIVQSDHKVVSKWDLAGSFTSYPGYNWGGQSPAGTPWTFEIHAKEAVDGKKSAGVVKFVSDTGVEFTGQVKAVDSDGYAYWSSRTDVLALAGTATYMDNKYYFMVLYAEEAIWLALSTTPYETYFNAESVWTGGLRAYQVHSMVSSGQFVIDPKFVHES